MGNNFDAGRFHAGRFSGNDGGVGQSSFVVSLSGLANNPTYGQTAQIGAQLIASAHSFSDGAPTAVAWQWRNSLGDIPGANGASYTPVATDDLENIYPVAIPSDTYAAKSGPQYAVRFAPPMISTALVDVGLQIGSGDRTIPTSGGFSGEDLSFSAVTDITGLQIDGSTGIISVDTNGGAQSGAITVSASNSGGRASRSFAISVFGEPFTVDVAGLVAGTAYVGTTVSAAVNWVVPVGEIDRIRWRSNGKVISGARTQTFDIEAAVEGTVLSCTVTTVNNGAKTSSSYPVAYSTPVLNGVLPDVSYDTGSGDQSINASTVFVGNGMSFALATTISGATIDTATGIISIPTASVTSAGVTVTATNSGGSTSNSFNVSIANPNPTGNSVSFGALTLAGQGGVPAPVGATAITGGTATGYALASGKVAPTSNGSATAGTLDFDTGDQWQVSTEAGTFHVDGADRNARYTSELQTVLVNAGPHGNTIKLRPGSESGHVANKRFEVQNAPVTIKSEDPDNPGIISYFRKVESTGNNRSYWFENVKFRPGDISDYVTNGDLTAHVFDVGGEVEDLDFIDCEWEGWYNRDNWTVYDLRATIRVNGVSGGALVPGTYHDGTQLYLSKPGSGEGTPNDTERAARVQIWEIIDDGNGEYTIVLSDNVGSQITTSLGTFGFQDSSKFIDVSDTLSVDTFGDATGATGITLNVIKGDTVDPELSAAIAKKWFNQSGICNGRTRFLRNHFHDGTRPIAGKGAFVVEDCLIERFFNDAMQISAGLVNGKLTIKGNVVHTADSFGEFRSNPHGDLLQTDQNGDFPWDVEIVDNIHFKGEGWSELAGIFMGNLSYFQGIIANNIMLGAGHNIVVNPAANLTVQGNICLNNDDKQGETLPFMHVDNQPGGGTNVTVRNNITQRMDISSNASQKFNILLPHDQLGDFFDNSVDFSVAPQTVAEVLSRCTPKDPWSLGDSPGCVDNNGNHVAYTLLQAGLPAGPTSANVEITKGTGAGELDFNIVSLPYDGEDTIVSGEYSTDGGTSWATLPSIAPGPQAISSPSSDANGTLLDNTQYSCSVRFVNGVGAGPELPYTTVETGPSAFLAQGIDMTQSGLIENPIPTSARIPADTKKYLLSFWFYMPGTWSVYGNLMAYYSGNAERITVCPLSANRISFKMFDDAGVVIASLYTDGLPAIAVDTWHHMLVSYDSTPGGSGLQMLIDGVKPGWLAETQPAIDAALPADVERFSLHDYQPNNPHYIADFFEYVGESLDLSVPANVANFIDAAGKPVSLGSDGSAPFGSVPTRFLSGSTSTWNVDDANGRTLTVVGSALTTAPSSPSD